MKKILLSIIALSLIFSCSKKEVSPPSKGDQISLVATTGMIGDVAANIGQQRVLVYTMMGPGVDPHLYKAKAKDLSRLNEADLILYNGIHLEAKMGDVLEKLSRTQNIVKVSKDIPEDSLISVGEVHDPHIWFDVSNWMIVAKTIKEALIKTDPQGATIYEDNYQGYLKKLQKLEKYVKEQSQTIPKSQRIIITAHDAFNYFGRAYDFQVRGLQGLSTIDEAGTKDVKELADFIVQKKIKALFVESSVSPKSIEALQAAVADRGWQVAMGGELFSDAMGTGGTFEGTYIGMVTHNIDTIVLGLKGEEEL